MAQNRSTKTNGIPERKEQLKMKSNWNDLLQNLKWADNFMDSYTLSQNIFGIYASVFLSTPLGLGSTDLTALTPIYMS